MMIRRRQSCMVVALALLVLACTTSTVTAQYCPAAVPSNAFGGLARNCVSGDPRLCFNCWCAVDAYAAANVGTPLVNIIGDLRSPSWAPCMASLLTNVVGLTSRDIAALTDAFCVNGLDSSKCPGAGGSAGARAKSTGTPKISAVARARAATAAKKAPAAKAAPGAKKAPEVKPLANAGHRLLLSSKQAA